MLPSPAEIEAAALKGWPSLETERDGKWVLRAADGYTYRANSIQSLDPADDENAAARIKYAQDWYKARNLPAVFRVTPLTGRKTLAALDAAKWASEKDSFCVATELGRMPSDPRVEMLRVIDPAFVAAQKLLQGYDDAKTAQLSAILWSIAVPAAGLVMSVNGAPVASALMAVADGIVITGNVITAKEHRGKGYAFATMNSGLAWAQTQGARNAALNVQADNAIAMKFYERVGYRYAYDYVYRVAPK